MNIMLENPKKIERFMAREARQASESLHVSPDMVKKEKRAIHSIFRRRRIPTILVWLLILVVVAGAAYYFGQRRNAQSSSKPAAKAQQENQTVIAQVGKLMLLPQDEQPTIATVSDKSKLGNQDFFKNAEDGDEILVYPNAQLAIIYRPSINKIVNVAPLFTDQNSTAGQTASTAKQVTAQSSSNSHQASQSNSSPSSQPQTSSSTAGQTVSAASPVASSANSPDVQTTPLKVEIENGSTTVGLAGDVQNKLSGISGVSVIGTGDAKGNYTNTVVVDLTQKNPALVLQVAQSVSGQIENLPAGESAPTGADVLVIVGNNASQETSPQTSIPTTSTTSGTTQP